MAWPCFEEAEETVTPSCDNESSPGTTLGSIIWAPASCPVDVRGPDNQQLCILVAVPSPAPVLPSNRGDGAQGPQEAPVSTRAQRGAPGHPQGTSNLQEEP